MLAPHRPSLSRCLRHALAALAAFCVLSTLGTAPLSAQRASAADRDARALFEQGVHAAEQERWADALELFRRSRAIVQRPSVLYNEAQMLVRLSRFVEAQTALDDYQAAVRGTSEPAERERLARAETLESEVRTRVATLILRVTPAEATIEVDGHPLAGEGTVRTLVLDPGRHAITVRAEGCDPRSMNYSLLSGTRAEERISLPQSSATRLIVETGESGAQIEVDGEPFGVGRAEGPVRGGTHLVRVIPVDGPARERRVEIEPGTTLNIDLRAGGGSSGGIAQEPWFWVVIGVVLVGGAAGGIVAATYDPGVEAPIPGDIGPGGVVEALRF